VPSAAEAVDVVQGAWLRWQSTDHGSGVATQGEIDEIRLADEVRKLGRS
jgi:hypothetical protein